MIFIIRPIHISVLFSMLIITPLMASFTGNNSFDIENDDLNLGGDIFTDFHEEIDASNVMEDERFYQYGRFFSFNLSMGMTAFDGNRGKAYENEHPTYGLSFDFFSDFNNSYTLGVEYSLHHFYLDHPVHGHNTDHENPDDGEGVGLVEVSMLRAFFGYRYHIETSDLGTAITYSNPYATIRMEYWYMQNKFIDRPDISPDEKGGGLGVGIGGGLEFPIKLQESYIGLEVLVHIVSFKDKYTQNYRPVANSTTGFGYNDFTGRGYSFICSYVIAW